jgi:hypothetical protein
MIAPPIPMKRIKTSTTVSPMVWADLVGRINAWEPAAAPSIIALIMPDANAKKTMRYKIAATITSLEVFDDTEKLDNNVYHEPFDLSI